MGLAFQNDAKWLQFDSAIAHQRNTMQLTKKISSRCPLYHFNPGLGGFPAPQFWVSTFLGGSLSPVLGMLWFIVFEDDQ